ncbi:MAG: CPBP family intramembrane metalloprotease [Oscillospiraceae bacterium]|nr:CPBP family intramembrane metalloprotease [Oscillospiraceae bacterium]
MEKKAFRRISLTVLAVGVLWVTLFYLPIFIWDFSLDDIFSNVLLAETFSLVMSLFGYGIIILIYYLFLRKLPTLEGEPKHKMKLSEFLGWACSMRGVAMVLSVVGLVILVILIFLIKGPSGIMDIIMESNPFFRLVSVPMIMQLFLMSVIAPVMEEILFRRLLLDVLRPFGDVVAILYSGIAFGLLHMNVHQITFACGLGIMLGYVMVKTNNLLYCIALHAILNASSAILLPFMGNIGESLENLSLLLPVAFILGAILFISVVGVILVFMNLKRISFEKARFRFLVPINAKLVMFSAGTIPYILLCLAVAVTIIILA